MVGSGYFFYYNPQWPFRWNTCSTSRDDTKSNLDRIYMFKCILVKNEN